MNELSIRDELMEQRHTDIPIELYLKRHLSRNERNIIANTFAFGNEVTDPGQNKDYKTAGMCVHLGRGVFVTNHHVIDFNHEENVFETPPESLKLPKSLFNMKGRRFFFEAKPIVLPADHNRTITEDILFFHLNPDKYKWVNRLPNYAIVKQQEEGIGRTSCVGNPMWIFPRGTFATREFLGTPVETSLNLENIGGQVSVRTNSSDIPKKFEDSRHNPYWIHTVLTTPGYSGGPFIHNGFLHGLSSRSYFFDNKKDYPSQAIDIKYILQKARELVQ